MEPFSGQSSFSLGLGTNQSSDSQSEGAIAPCVYNIAPHVVRPQIQSITYQGKTSLELARM